MAWSGYEVTDEQKKARRDLDILVRQKDIVKDIQDLVRLDPKFSSDEKDLLKKTYQEVIERIDNEISQQQISINDKWSLLKKAAIAIGAAAAATVAGLLFSNRWYGAESK